MIAYWNAATQSWIQHIQNLPPNNFAPKVGYPYMMTCQSAGIWPTSLPPLKAPVGDEAPLSVSRGVMKLNSAPASSGDR